MTTEPIDKATLDRDLAVAPPPPKVRTAHDASDDPRLKRDPADADAKLDVSLDESFPTSDPPGSTPRGHSDPAPSSGYDEAAERERQASS